MRRVHLLYAAVAAAAVAPAAFGQTLQPGAITTPPPSLPPVSPYLNLLRGGSSPLGNYYGLVKPELELRSGLQSVQRQADLNSRSIGALQGNLYGNQSNLGPGQTGTRAYFNNTMGYFSGGARARASDAFQAPPQNAGATGLQGGGGQGPQGRGMARPTFGGRP